MMVTCHNCGVIIDAGGEWIKDKFFCTDCASYIKTADYLKEEYFRLQSRLAEAEALLKAVIEAAKNLNTPCDWERIPYYFPPEYRCRRCGQETMRSDNQTCPAYKKEFKRVLEDLENYKPFCEEEEVNCESKD